MEIAYDRQAAVKNTIIKEDVAPQLSGSITCAGGVNGDRDHFFKSNIVDLGGLAGLQLIVILDLGTGAGRIGLVRGICAGASRERQQHDRQEQCQSFFHHHTSFFFIF